MLDTNNVNEKTVKQILGSYDEELLNTLPGGTTGPGRYVSNGSESDILLTWIDVDGMVCTGRARVLRRFENTMSQPYVEASPFPGAWAMVSLDRILGVTRISLI